VPLLRLRLSSGLLRVVLRPQGRLDIQTAKSSFSQRPLLALMPGCPPQAPTPAFRRRSIHTLFAAKIHAIVVPLPEHESIRGDRVLNRNIGRPEREIFCSCTTITLKSPPYGGFSATVDSANRAAGISISPRPYQAWHGYGAIRAHHGEMEVCAGGSASALPSGPPAGAGTSYIGANFY
jgi:hypothetical protein